MDDVGVNQEFTFAPAIFKQWRHGAGVGKAIHASHTLSQ